MSSSHTTTIEDHIMFQAPRITTLIAAVLLSMTTASQASNVTDPYGTPAHAPAAQREIRIDATTKYVNVKRGEIVRFITAQGSFAWSFDTDRNRNQFDLARIAPKTLAADGIRVFIADPADER